MKIIILLDEQFPYGMASANRALLYAKGFVNIGNDVSILIPRATERPDKIRNFAVRGEYEGVKYRYAWESIIRRSFIGRRFQNFISLLNSFLYLVRSRPDVIIIAANNFKYIILGKTCALLTGAKLIREKSEVPFYKIEKLSWIRKLRIKTEFRLFDGIIVISGALKDFFHNDLKLDIKIVELPILVDSSTSAGTNGFAKTSNLVYTGSMLDHKDGVLTIIKAFSRVWQNHPELRLVMTGNLDGSVNKDAILSLIRTLKLDDSVELTGYLPREQIKELTSSAFSLLLAKPANRQNRYNMATKIGEYLLAGRPAIISSVDPVCRYLTHRENACITDPDEASMAREIEFLLDNPSKADAIGSSGKKSVARLFDYKIYAPGLISFFREL